MKRIVHTSLLKANPFLWLREGDRVGLKYKNSDSIIGGNVKSIKFDVEKDEREVIVYNDEGDHSIDWDELIDVTVYRSSFK